MYTTILPCTLILSVYTNILLCTLIFCRVHYISTVYTKTVQCTLIFTVYTNILLCTLVMWQVKKRKTLKTGNGSDQTRNWFNIVQCTPINPHDTSEVELNWYLSPFRSYRSISGFTKNRKRKWSNRKLKICSSDRPWSIYGGSLLWLFSLRRAISEKNAKNQKPETEVVKPEVEKKLFNKSY